jgi:uncharacterized DUF497 family protein
MQEDNFEWDDRKAASNYRKHRAPFELARSVFDDPRAVERRDFDEPDEERFLVTGLANE